jgi:hypothetical protein
MGEPCARGGGGAHVTADIGVAGRDECTSSSEARAVDAASLDAAACVEVVIRRGNGQASPEPQKACVP